MDVAKVSQQCRLMIDQIEKVIIGKTTVLEDLLIGILSNGHVLIEDVPGLAKTLIARSFARIMNLEFSRIQFTPDLLPGDITGSNIYDRTENTFVFSRGPVFSHIVLADEINRASPKTQSALLEAMQEAQVTIEGTRHTLDRPFIVFATQNPIEFEGTYPLPEAQLDRFIMKLAVGYPDKDHEIEILMRRQERRKDDVDLQAVVSREDVIEMQLAVEQVYMSEEIGAYIVDIVRATRSDSRVQLGASPRGSLALFKLARSAAALDARDFVTPEDVKKVAKQGLSHRIMLKPEVWMRDVPEEEIVADILQRVPVPRPLDSGP